MSEFRFAPWRFWHWGTWGILAFVCLAYGLFATAAGLTLVETDKLRALPIAFQIHALAGGVVLIMGIIQFNPTIRAHLAWSHRWGGRIYVASALVASTAAVINAAFFDVDWPARLSFTVLGIIWFLVTVVAFVMVRKQKFAAHREWMARSFSLALFFVTFSVWVPALAESGLEQNTAYVVAVTLSWVVNLVCAEIWIRLTRAHSRLPSPSKSCPTTS